MEKISSDQTFIYTDLIYKCRINVYEYDVVLKMFISFIKFYFTASDTFSQLLKKAKYLPENWKPEKNP